MTHSHMAAVAPAPPWPVITRLYQSSTRDDMRELKQAAATCFSDYILQIFSFGRERNHLSMNAGGGESPQRRCIRGLITPVSNAELCLATETCIHAL